jgi:hypothetical protein
MIVLLEMPMGFPAKPASDEMPEPGEATIP